MTGMRRKTSQEGFSLIEVMIALTILAVGLLGIALLQVTAVKGNASANEVVVATQYAQDQMEIFRRTAFDNIVSSAGISSGQPNFAAIPGDVSVQSIVTKKGVRIYRVWNVASTTTTLKTISVWACWRDEKGVWRTALLVTQKGNVS